MKRTHRYISLLCVVAFALFAAAPCLDHRQAAPDLLFGTSALPSTLQGVDASWSSGLVSELGLVPLVGDSGPAGSGIIVGIVDTGVDGSVLIPESLKDWIDITGEGEIVLSDPIAPSSGGAIDYGGQSFQVKGIPSKSGRLRVGEFSSASLPAEAPLREVVGSKFKFFVVAADTYITGQYDTVYVDTNGDGSFVNEKGLEVFRNSRASVPVALPGGRYLQVVLADILNDGAVVSLGFDGHGHGTSVASVLAGNAPGLVPLAPNANLIAVKAVDSSGRTGWDLLAQGILAACRKGAQVVIMSVAPLVPGDNSDRLDDAIRRVEKEYGALVVVAAGNKGPGISSLPDYAEIPNVLPVGAYIPFGAGTVLGVQGGRMWPWSSLGPTSQGATVSLVAPAVGPAQVPGWAAARNKTWLFEGTSCAAAYAGGAVVALASAQVSRGASFSPVLLKEVLEDTAKPLSNASAVEQGSGVLDADGASKALKAGDRYPRVRVVTEWGGRYQTAGFFDRDRIPGFIPFGVDSFLPFEVSLSLGLPAWGKADTASLSIPAVEQREFALRVNTGLPQGLTSGFITGDDPLRPGLEMKALTTVVVPRQLGEAGFAAIQRVLDAGKLHREYLRVDPGVETLTVALEVPLTAGKKPRGRERLYVYDGTGSLAYEGPWIGAGAFEVEDEVKIAFPGAGVWEVVVLSDPSSAAFEVTEASFRLTFMREGLAATGSYWPLKVPLDDGSPATGEVRVFNRGGAFECMPAVIQPGKNGEVVVERLFASSSVSIAKSLAGVIQGTRYIHLGISEVSDPACDIDVYLYSFDKDVNRWIEIMASSKPGSSEERLTLVDPAPGQYIAYIEVKSLAAGQVTFKWTSVVARDVPGYEARERLSGSKQFTWPQGSDRNIAVSVPNGFSSGKENRVYLSLWDDVSGELRNLIPMTVTGKIPSILAYAGVGNRGKGSTAVTLSAWDSTTFKAVDALVRLGDVWFQLRNGKATIVLDKDILEGMELYAECPGMYPKHKVIIHE